MKKINYLKIYKTGQPQPFLPKLKRFSYKDIKKEKDFKMVILPSGENKMKTVSNLCYNVSINKKYGEILCLILLINWL